MTKTAVSTTLTKTTTTTCSGHKNGATTFIDWHRGLHGSIRLRLRVGQLQQLQQQRRATLRRVCVVCVRVCVLCGLLFTISCRLATMQQFGMNSYY